MSKFGVLTSLLAGQDIKASLFDPNKAKHNKQRRYLHLMRGVNMYSHSTSELWNACERKFACSKLQQNQPIQIDDVVTLEGNIDFAFGRAIESGVQSALLGNPREKIFFDMFLAWDIKLMQQHPKNYAKTFTDAVIAIDKFMYIKTQLMQGWEIAMFKGRPAIELAMLLDMENGFYYVGHADIILFHPIFKLYRVMEIKTNGMKNIDEALYKNSGQALGYSIFVDQIASSEELAATFEVQYLVFGSGLDQWTNYEFTKSRSNRADWINSILIDLQRIDTSRKLNYFPKRGNQCFNWGRRCQYYDSCDLDPSSFNPTGKFALITEDEIGQHAFDFRFKFSEVLETQKELIK